MKTKMAAVFLALIVSLGVTGLGAAWWREELYINGTVTTGTFCWEMTLWEWGVSGDWKDIIDADVWLGDYVNSYAKSLNFYAYDMYPCTDLWIWWDLEFHGSVPGHLYDVTVVASENGVELTEIPDYVYLYCYVDGVSQNLYDQGITIGPWDICAFLNALKCTQWHDGDWIDVYWHLHLIEEGMELWDPMGNYIGIVPPGIEVPMDTTLDVTVTFDGEQFNYP